MSLFSFTPSVFNLVVFGVALFFFYWIFQQTTTWNLAVLSQHGFSLLVLSVLLCMPGPEVASLILTGGFVTCFLIAILILIITFRGGMGRISDLLLDVLQDVIPLTFILTFLTSSITIAFDQVTHPFIIYGEAGVTGAIILVVTLLSRLWRGSKEDYEEPEFDY